MCILCQCQRCLSQSLFKVYVLAGQKSLTKAQLIYYYSASLPRTVSPTHVCVCVCVFLSRFKKKKYKKRKKKSAVYREEHKPENTVYFLTSLPLEDVCMNKCMRDTEEKQRQDTQQSGETTERRNEHRGKQTWRWRRPSPHQSFFFSPITKWHLGFPPARREREKGPGTVASRAY